MKKILPILILSFFFLTLSLLLPKQVKASGTLYFSPGGGTKYNGQNFTVSVRAGGMDNVDGVRAVFTYPTDKLTFVSINSTSSDWGIKAQETVSGGTIELDRGNIGNLSGDKLVAYVTFRPRTNSGTATLALTSDCVLTLAGSNVISGKTNATFTLANAPPPPPPPVVDKTPPTISNIKVTNLSVNTATITWTTNKASDSSVNYGLSQSYILTASNGSLVTNHSVDLNKDFLEPGTTYHFIVISKDSSGNVAKSSDQTFSVLGYDVKVTVVDTSGKPLAKTKVTLHSTEMNATTDGSGRVVFKNVTVGEHVLTANVNGQELAATINVLNVGAKPVQTKDKQGNVVTVFTTEPQSFNVKLAAANSSFNLVQIASLGTAGILLGLLIGVGVFYLIRSRKTKPFN